MRGQHHGKRLRPGLFVAIIVDREPHRNAGVVDDDVESAEMGRDVVHNGNDVIAIGDIEGPGPGLSAIGGDFIGDGLRTLGTDVGDRDIGAFGREHARGSRPMPLAAPVTRTVRPLTERLSCLKSDMVGSRN